MRTKIVYVVASDETDLILEQALLSVFSLRKHNPDAIVEIVMDSLTHQTITEKRSEILRYVNNVVVVDAPGGYNKVLRSRWMKTSLRQYVTGNFLYIDTDTIITDNLEDIDAFPGVIGAVLDQHQKMKYNTERRRLSAWSLQDEWTCFEDVEHFNGGVIYSRDCDLSRKFFQEWHRRWMISQEKYSRYLDQSPLAATNECLGFPIKQLSGEWNCQTSTNSLPYIYQAKIMHYLMYDQDNYAWVFYDKSILQEIKETGCISERISSLVDLAKVTYRIPHRIIAGRDLELFDSAAVLLLKRSRIVLIGIDYVARILQRLNRIRRKYFVF